MTSAPSDTTTDDAPPAGSRWGVVVPLAFACALWAPGLATGSIINGDDALYAIVLGRIHDGAAYFDVAGWRPPLFYGLAILSTGLLGLGELGLRAASLLSGLVAVAATWAAARALMPRRPAVALWAPMLVASTGQFFLFARRVRGLDLLLTALVALAVAVGVAARDRVRWWAAVGCVLGLAFATKSVVVVVAGPALALTWWQSTDGATTRLRTAGAAVVGALVVGGVWPLWMLVAGAGNAARDHVANHVIRRSVDATMVAAEGTGYGFYLEQLVLNEGVFALMALVGLAVLAVRAMRAERGAVLTLAWAGGVLLPFTVVATRLPHYMLPAYPALAIAAAAAIDGLGARTGRRAAPHVLGALAVVAALAAGPMAIPAAWGSADYSPHLKAAAERANALVGAEGVMGVWNEYHAAADYYFHGRAQLWTDDAGFLAAYSSTHGFIEGLHFVGIPRGGALDALLAAAPACLVVRDGRDPAGSVHAMGRSAEFVHERLDGADLYCATQEAAGLR